MPAGDVDENRSAWALDLPPDQPGAALRGSLAVDVAIIGGGLTGVSTAWHLIERHPGLGIALLEARALGNGASGRNGGQVLNGVNGLDPSDPASILRLYSVTHRGIDLVESLAARHGIDAGFRRGGSLDVATDAARAEARHRRAEDLAAIGLPLRWVPRAELGLAGAHGAVLDPTAAVVNSLALVRGMRRPLIEQGVRIFESTAVRRVHEGAAIELETDHGRVLAKALVLATNAYTPSLGYFRRQILPLHSHVIATAPLSEAQWDFAGWGTETSFSDDLDRVAYGARAASGRLILGGGSNAAYSYLYGGRLPRPQDEVRAARGGEAVRRVLARYLPRLSAEATPVRWTGTLGVTLDRVCSMGVGGSHRNVYWALGYSGHGLALATLAGVVLRDLYDGDDTDWRGLAFLQRQPPRMPPEPLRWLGYQAYTRLTGRSPRR